MDNGTYRYRFGAALPLQEIEDSLLLAAMAAESLHGRAQVHLDGAFRLDRSARTCVVDARTEVGRDIARIFTGYLTREFGEDAFKVDRTPEGR